jgi:hypothetical protein
VFQGPIQSTKICINENWNNVLAEEDANAAETLENASEFDTNDESKNETPVDTLVHGFIDS